MSDPAARNAPALASDPAWTAYGDTILVMGNDDILARVDLRRRLTTGMRDLLVTMAGGERFGIVTPHDPGGRTLDDAENAARVRALRDELEREGLPYFRADGQNESGSHGERGFAIARPSAASPGARNRPPSTGSTASGCGWCRRDPMRRRSHCPRRPMRSRTISTAMTAIRRDGRAAARRVHGA